MQTQKITYRDGTVYNADADRRAWDSTLGLLRECFA